MLDSLIETIQLLISKKFLWGKGIKLLISKENSIVYIEHQF